jgi:small-conductance mechanosensitive channel
VRQRTDRARSDAYTAVSICPDMVVPGRTPRFDSLPHAKGKLMNNIIYIVGLIVIVIAVLSFLGLR